MIHRNLELLFLSHYYKSNAMIALKERIEASKGIFQCCFNIAEETLQEQYQSIAERRNFIINTKASLDSSGDIPSGMLKLNIGGKKYDILREMLLENTEWNLLSCLFQPRWEGYFPDGKDTC